MSSIARTVAAAISIFSSFHGTNALWRLQCEGIAGMARIDPLINPGKASSHMHTIKGSGGKSILPSSKWITAFDGSGDVKPLCNLFY